VAVRTEIGSAAHADWTQSGSRMLDEDGRAGRGVGLRIGGWLQGEPRSGDGSLVGRVGSPFTRKLDRGKLSGCEGDR
jgi:hypothetical protein